MGLFDRDYMHERRRTSASERSVFTPPESDRIGFFSGLAAVILILIVWAIVKAYHFWQERYIVSPHAPLLTTNHKSTPPQQEQPQRRNPQLTGNWDPASQAGHTQSPATSSRETSVIKCVSAGKVTFSDGPCEAGAQASTVRIQRTNIADAPLPPKIQQPTEAAPQTTVVVQQPPAIVVEQPDAAVLRQQECAAIESTINNIDARARQPLSAWEQDDLRSRRKQLRDRQFALHC